MISKLKKKTRTILYKIVNDSYRCCCGNCKESIKIINSVSINNGISRIACSRCGKNCDNIPKEIQKFVEEFNDLDFLWR